MSCGNYTDVHGLDCTVTSDSEPHHKLLSISTSLQLPGCLMRLGRKFSRCGNKERVTCVGWGKDERAEAADGGSNVKVEHPTNIYKVGLNLLSFDGILVFYDQFTANIRVSFFKHKKFENHWMFNEIMKFLNVLTNFLGLPDKHKRICLLNII